MGLLRFRKSFWEAIARGTKRTTVRRWDRPRLKVGQRAFAPGVGWLKIEAVEAIDLGAFTDDDARVDGFTSLREMLDALAEMYPQRDDGKRWFRVGFHVTRKRTKARNKLR